MANKYFRQYHESVSAAEHTLYTVPDANSAIVSSLRVTNANSTDATINVTVYPLGGATGYKVLRDSFLPVNGTMDVLSGIPLVLEATDELAVEASEDDIVFYLSYLEIDRN
jgi:hypothetical protein